MKRGHINAARRPAKPCCCPTKWRPSVRSPTAKGHIHTQHTKTGTPKFFPLQIFSSGGNSTNLLVRIHYAGRSLINRKTLNDKFYNNSFNNLTHKKRIRQNGRAALKMEGKNEEQTARHVTTRRVAKFHLERDHVTQIKVTWFVSTGSTALFSPRIFIPHVLSMSKHIFFTWWI